MNAPEKIDPDTFAAQLAQTREPFPASKKIHAHGSLHADLQEAPLAPPALPRSTFAASLAHTARAGPAIEPVSG